MKRRIIAIVLSIVVCLFTPMTLLFMGLSMPNQYEKTYYAQLVPMYRKVCETTKKKIVLIGNSSVAFGVDSSLMEEELKKNGVDYEVCHFGLYGSLGTKLMMDLSIKYIKEGDIVIFMPEPHIQSLSLYFSAMDTWRAIDGDWSLFWDIEKSNRQSLIGSFSQYISEKHTHIAMGKNEGSGIYAKASFDENGDLKNYPRPNNTMLGGYDENSTITFNDSLLTKEFCAYVREYKEELQRKGARIYYALSPLNEMAVRSDIKQVEDFCLSAKRAFSMEILGEPSDSIMQAGWFYDSNFHLNESGMIAYTAILTDAIKTKLGIFSPNEIVVPPQPTLPEYEAPTDGDSLQADCFVYEETENAYKVVGLTEKGKTQTTLTIPVSYQEKPIIGFSAKTFQDNTIVREITLQTNIRQILDESFRGCTALEKLILKHSSASAISAGFGLLTGAENCKIYVKQDAISKFYGDYVWGFYLEYIRGYNE